MKVIVYCPDDPGADLKVGAQVAVWPLDEGGEFRKDVVGPSGYVEAILPDGGPLKVWSIEYTRIPTNFNDTRVARVKAESGAEALALLKDKLMEPSTPNHVYRAPEEYVAPEVAGEVLSLG